MTRVKDKGVVGTQQQVRLDKKVCDSSDLCHICWQSVSNGQVASVSTSALFPRRDMCPQVTDLCQIRQLQKGGFNLGRSEIW